MAKNTVQEIRVDVVTRLNNPNINIRLIDTKVPVPEKSLVVYSKGARSRGSWHYSGLLGGSYKYFPAAGKGKNPVLELGLMVNLSLQGVSLRIRTWGSNSLSLGEIAHAIEVEVSGMQEHTCEMVKEIYRVDLSAYAPKPSVDLVPISKKVTTVAQKSRVKQLAQPLKQFSSARAALRAFRTISQK